MLQSVKSAMCARGILELITATIPIAIRNSRTTIDLMNPAEAYAAVMRERFVLDVPFSNVLTGLAASTDKAIDIQKSALPHFTFPEFKATEGEPEAARKLRQEIHALERLVALVEWWITARPAFGEAWTTLIGKKLENGAFPLDCVEGKLVQMLEQALGHARPLDDLSKHLTHAATAVAASINAIQTELRGHQRRPGRS